MDKFYEKLGQFIQKIKKSPPAKPSMRVVIGYLCFVVLLLFTWYGAWWFKFNLEGKPDLSILSNFIVICLGATAFFGFITERLVDKNHNGIPDILEGDKNERNRHRGLEREPQLGKDSEREPRGDYQDKRR